MFRLRALLIGLILLLTTASSVHAAGGSSADKANLYYVSVGDSLAASVQPVGDPADLYRTHDGYAEQLLTQAQARSPKLSLIKLGCPGESTGTMIHGGICTYPRGSQLDEAVAFLKAHRPFVAFVTIDIGANDFPCQDVQCVPAGVAAIQTNLPAILSALGEAAGPGVPIVGMTLYNPFLAAWLTGADGQAFAQLSQQQVSGPVNGLLRAIYGGSGAAVADVEGAFASNDFSTIVSLPGVGDVPINVARICMWTWACALPPLGPDNHANTTGYGVIANAFAVAIGL
jgi:lysophospholipase L1-like esterase